LFNSRTSDNLICVRIVIGFAMVLTIASGSILAILIGIGALCSLCRGDIDTVKKRGAAACQCFFVSVLCIAGTVISFVICTGDGDTADAVYCSSAVFNFLRAGEGIAALLWMVAGIITSSLIISEEDELVMPLPASLRARPFIYIPADDRDSIDPSTDLEII
jgi:hypothetical protein